MSVVRKLLVCGTLAVGLSIGAIPSVELLSAGPASATEVSSLTIEVFPGTDGDYVVIKDGKVILWKGWVPH